MRPCTRALTIRYGSKTLVNIIGCELLFLLRLATPALTHSEHSKKIQIFHSISRSMLLNSFLLVCLFQV